jgi:hypothetical protein
MEHSHRQQHESQWATASCYCLTKTHRYNRTKSSTENGASDNAPPVGVSILSICVSFQFIPDHVFFISKYSASELSSQATRRASRRLAWNSIKSASTDHDEGMRRQVIVSLKLKPIGEKSIKTFGLWRKPVSLKPRTGYYGARRVQSGLLHKCKHAAVSSFGCYLATSRYP